MSILRLVTDANRTRWSIIIGALALLSSMEGRARAQALDVDNWLRRPGVKQVVVEFFATWCKPCLEAVPRWKALHEKYQRDGLRLIVVVTSDPGGDCVNPGWTPDEIICDDDGQIAAQYGANPLPAAYLWGWQGHLMASRSKVAEVEALIHKGIEQTPRISVEVANLRQGARTTKKALRGALRRELRRADKFVLRGETYALPESVLKLTPPQLRLKPCPKDGVLAGDYLLRATIVGQTYHRMRLQLLSAEGRCVAASAVTRWNPSKMLTSVSDSVSALLRALRLKNVQYPWGRDGVQGKAKAVLKVPRGPLVITGKPEGARVFVDGDEVGQLPFQDTFPVGPHIVEVQKDELYATYRQSIELEQEGLRMQVDLLRRFGILAVRSNPSGADIYLEGLPTGAQTPHTFPPQKKGRYTIELRLPDHQPVAQEVDLSDGETKEIQLNLAPIKNGLRVRPSWVFWSLGAIAGIGSGVAYGLADARQGRIDDAGSPDNVLQEIDAVRVQRTVGAVSLGAAGGLAVIGLVLEILDRRGPKPSVAVGPDGALSVGAMGQF